MLINQVNKGSFVIEFTQHQFSTCCSTYTVLCVRMTNCYGTGATQIKAFEEYVDNSEPEKVKDMFADAWRAFRKACEFCRISPVEDSDYAAHIAIGSRWEKCA